MRKEALVLAASGLLLVGVTGTAQAEGPPRHGHMLVLGVEYAQDGEPIGFRKCVDLAAGRALPLGAHHAHAHTGNAGEALSKAGHAVVPTAPLWPEVHNCADLEEMFGR